MKIATLVLASGGVLLLGYLLWRQRQQARWAALSYPKQLESWQDAATLPLPPVQPLQAHRDGSGHRLVPFADRRRG